MCTRLATLVARAKKRYFFDSFTHPILRRTQNLNTRIKCINQTIWKITGYKKRRKSKFPKVHDCYGWVIWDRECLTTLTPRYKRCLYLSAILTILFTRHFQALSFGLTPVSLAQILAEICYLKQGSLLWHREIRPNDKLFSNFFNASVWILLRAFQQYKCLLCLKVPSINMCRHHIYPCGWLGADVMLIGLRIQVTWIQVYVT